MSFAVDWLDLRENADNAARDAVMKSRVGALLARAPDPLVVDLGAGAGSTMRALAGTQARWRLVDNDPALLAEAVRRAGSGLDKVEMDLTRIDDLPIDDASLVTASALFDLVSAMWIDAFTERLAQARVGLYAALSYDGALRWEPADGDDHFARDAFNADQRTDKGFGPALGPEGAPYLARSLQARGYTVTVAQSPWRLGEEDADLHVSLLEGIAQAAGRSGMADADAWLARKLSAVRQTRCTVGHLDVLALPV